METHETKIKEISTIELRYLCDDDFKRDIDESRKKLGIGVDDDGLTSVDNMVAFDRKLLLNKDLRKRYNKEIDYICKKHILSDHEIDVQMFIESGMTSYAIIKGKIARNGGRITKPEMKPRRWSKWSKGGTLPPSSGIRVSFVIRKYIVDKDLKNWLKKYKSDILIAVNDYFSKTKPSITKLDRLDRAIKIIRMKDVEGKKFREIADCICEENPDDPEVQEGKVNEQSIKMLYYRYKKRFKK